MNGLDCIETLVETAPTQLSFLVPTLIPIVSESMWDTKPEVKKKAYGTMEKICKLIENKDIEKFIPELIKCIAKPENVPETVHLLGATTFVTDVHEPTLAIMVPLLERGLVERETAIKRKSAVIVDNMCKLVEDPQMLILCTEEVWAVMDGKMTPSGHNWVSGQGSGPRLKGDDGDEEEKFDAMGNKIVSTKKAKKLTSSEARKKKKERMARRKRGEEVFSDEDDI